MTVDRWIQVAWMLATVVFAAGALVTSLKNRHDKAEAVREVERRLEEREHSSLDRRFTDLRDELRRVEGKLEERIRDAKNDVDGVGGLVRPLTIEVTALRVKVRALQQHAGVPALDQTPSPD